MDRLLPFLAALAFFFTGCANIVRSTGAAPYPRDGTYKLYARDGRLMQKSIWRGGKLWSAWERDGDGRWNRVATSGDGRLMYFDEDGHEYGFADYSRGEYRRGAH